MRFRIGAVVLAGALFGAAALYPVVSEGRGGRWVRGGCGPCGQTQIQCQQPNENCAPDRKRWRDGSCGNAECQKQGAQRDCPGPGGRSQGAGPRDGSGTPPAAK